MKAAKQFIVIGISSAILGFGGPIRAQTDAEKDVSATTEEPDRSSRIVSADQVNQDYPTLFDILRAQQPEYPKLSPEIRSRLSEFKRARDRYLREQEELIKKIKGATEAERDRIREQLRDRRLQWLERSRSYRESAQERYRRLLRELPKHREVIEAAQENAREEARETRPRPGVD